MTVTEFWFPPEILLIGTNGLSEYKSTLSFDDLFRDDLPHDKHDYREFVCHVVPKSHSNFPPNSEYQLLLFPALGSEDWQRDLVQNGARSH